MRENNVLSLNSKIESPHGDEFWIELEKNSKNKVPKINKKDVEKNYEDFFNMISDDETIKKIEPGQIVSGIIETITRKEISISINYKDCVYVENTSLDWKIVKNLNVGDTIDVLIKTVNSNPYTIKGSISDIIKAGVDDKIKKYYIENTPVEILITDKNTAGFFCKFEIDGVEINGFMPNTIASSNKLTDDQTSDMVGQRILVCLETLKEDKGLYVVNRKKYLQLYKFEEEISKLEIGEKIYHGKVTGTTPFGVFVEFNECLTGMIHKVNLNPAYKIENIRAGQGVEFYVKDIAKKGKQIICTQILRESLWDTIKTGMILEGTVKNSKPFGTMIELDEETMGVIHNNYIKKLNIKLKEGDKIMVKIVSVLRDERKIFLDVVEGE